MKLTGQCHEMNNFFEGLKNQSVLSLFALMVFYFLHLNCQEKILLKFLLAYMKTLILDISQEAASEFPTLAAPQRELQASI
jgi:hypothetical protein